MFIYYSPETKGLALEEISELFGDQVAVHLSLEDLDTAKTGVNIDRDSEKGDTVLVQRIE